jgi:hypothetical protein
MKPARHHPIGPVSLDLDDRGRLPWLGRVIVDLRSRERDDRQLADLSPHNPAWDDELCRPHEDDESRTALAPESRIHDRAVLLVGELGEFGPYLVGERFAAGSHRWDSTPFEVPDEDESVIAAGLQRLLARLGFS